MRIIEIINTWQFVPRKCQVNRRHLSVIFWGEMLGHHPGKLKLEHNKINFLIQIIRVSNNSSERITRVSNNSSECIRGVSNNSSKNIEEFFSNFFDMYSEVVFILSRISENLQGTPLIISEDLEVTPMI
jgi:hypothetical protein